MSGAVVTPPSRENMDWYRVKYQLASTRLNDAYVNGGGYEPAVAEVDGLLAVIWRMLSAHRSRNERQAQLRRFLEEIAEPAALVLKALADLGARHCDPGVARNLDIAAVSRELKAGNPVSPRTTFDAIAREKTERGPSLEFDFACFYVMCNDPVQARRCIDAGLAKVPSYRQARMRERIAVDPMLRTIPDGSAKAKGGLCLNLRRKPPPSAPRSPRAWI